MVSVHWDSNYTFSNITSDSTPKVTLPPNCQGVRILDPANPFNNVYRSGVKSKPEKVGAEWDKFVSLIDSLDLNEPDGVQKLLPRVQ